jgi:hypothetical protein
MTYGTRRVSTICRERDAREVGSAGFRVADESSSSPSLAARTNPRLQNPLTTANAGMPRRFRYRYAPRAKRKNQLASEPHHSRPVVGSRTCSK